MRKNRESQKTNFIDASGRTLLNDRPVRGGFTLSVVVFAPANLLPTNFLVNYVEFPNDRCKVLGYECCKILVNKNLLPGGWKQSIKMIKVPTFRMANGEVLTFKILVPLFVLYL